MHRRSLFQAAAIGAGVAALPGAATAAPGRRGRESVLTGFEVMARDDYRLVRGERVGLISNPTGIVRDLRHEFDVMVASGEVDLVAGFGPEHGFRGDQPAGSSGGDFVDERTGLRVFDTYTRTPAQIADSFREAGVDTVMFDIQDVGARFYTYIWTMYDCMVAAAIAGVRFVVLDRPNPIGGENAYGPVLEPENATFVGRKPISQQHGMTVGELATLFNDVFVPEDPNAPGPVELTVSEMEGWSRGMSFEETGLPWVMPSPNMPTVDTARVYPGTCLFEATNLSEGRGTTRPFELIGAPYVDHSWAAALQELDLRGVGFREAYFVPTTSKHVRETCAGVQLHVDDPERFDAIRTAIAMIVTAKRLFPDFAWRESAPPYWMDKLSGTEDVRLAIDSGAGVDEVVEGWQRPLREFRGLRRRYLRYRPGGGR